jgi:hypothetical protein
MNSLEKILRGGLYKSMVSDRVGHSHRDKSLGSHRDKSRVRHHKRGGRTKRLKKSGGSRSRRSRRSRRS